MSKVYEADKEQGWYLFHCPGCQTAHSFWVNNSEYPSWVFNGDLEKPTISPSHRVSDNKGTFCHSFITNGNIQFLNDSKHKLKGQTVQLPDFE